MELIAVALRLERGCKWLTMNRNGGSVSSGMVAQSWPDWWLNWVRNTQYSDIDDSAIGSGMEYDALAHRLKTLKCRLESAQKYSSIHIDVAFEQLEKIIIKEIERSARSIDIAVAWITNERICKALTTASNNGVPIRVIVHDDDTNRITDSLLGDGIWLRKCPRHGRYKQNLMHNKFSIFDENRVITGSYNWTNAANYHNENVVIILNDEIAKKLRVQFNELVKSIGQQRK